MPAFWGLSSAGAHRLMAVLVDQWSVMRTAGVASRAGLALSLAQQAPIASHAIRAKTAAAVASPALGRGSRLCAYATSATQAATLATDGRQTCESRQGEARATSPRFFLLRGSLRLTVTGGLGRLAPSARGDTISIGPFGDSGRVPAMYLCALAAPKSPRPAELAASPGCRRRGGLHLHHAGVSLALAFALSLGIGGHGPDLGEQLRGSLPGGGYGFVDEFGHCRVEISALMDPARGSWLGNMQRDHPTIRGNLRDVVRGDEPFTDGRNGYIKPGMTYSFCEKGVEDALAEGLQANIQPVNFNITASPEVM